MYEKTVHAWCDMSIIINMRYPGRITIVWPNHKITRTQDHNLKSYSQSRNIM